MSTPVGRVPTQRLALSFPRSLGVFTEYEQAQKAVDYLSDNQFPVENCMIVGTDLRQVERVTGRLTLGRVLGGGLLSGMWLGLFVGAILALFANEGSLITMASTVMLGGIFGVIWAGLGYMLTRGRRDFTSVSQVVATRYEVLVEHKLYDQGRQLIAQMPGGAPAAAQASGVIPPPPPDGRPEQGPPPPAGQAYPGPPPPDQRPRPQYGEYAPTPGDPDPSEGSGQGQQANPQQN